MIRTAPPRSARSFTAAGIPSDELCGRALAAYSALATTIAYCDEPDLGLEIHIAAGRRAIAARMAATQWRVGPTLVASAEAVIASAPPPDPCESAIEWLENFPTAFLAVLDRRLIPTIPVSDGRRSWDRVSRDVASRANLARRAG